MSKSKTLFTVLLMTVIAVAVPVAGAQTLHILGSGSSALYTPTEIAAVNDIAQLATQCAGGVFPNVAAGTCEIHHFSITSSCPGVCAAQLHDTRTNPSIGPIPNEPGNLWVVWVTNHATAAVTDVWADLSVDSTVGVRTFLSRVNGSAGTTSATQALVATGSFPPANNADPALLQYGVAEATPVAPCTAAQTTCDDPTLPAAVATFLNGKFLTAGFTDIRPEDAKYATKRAAGPVNNLSGLGYGTIGSQLVTQAIQSSYSTPAAIATPVEFGVIGAADPISLAPVPASIQVFPLGEAPIVFIANRSNANGLGALVAPLQPAFADLEDNNGVFRNPLSDLFSGTDCSGAASAFKTTTGAASLAAAGIANFPITVAIREPLSGTMNTTEYTEFRTSGTTNVIVNNQNVPQYVWNTNPWPGVNQTPTKNGAEGGSQEYDIWPGNPASPNPDNPLNKPCQTVGGVTGHRRRGVGTGEIVKTAVKNNADTIGYTFFGFGNVSAIANQAAYGYLTIDQVDGIFHSYDGTFGDPGQPADSTGANTNNGGKEWGVLPVCTTNGAAGIPACNATTFWSGGLNGMFPHIQDGTYRSWSLLRMLCDTVNDTHCLASSDATGAQALTIQAQAEIMKGTSAPDFLPFLTSAQVGLAAGLYNGASFVRSHYDMRQFSQYEKSIPFVHFVDQGTTTPPVGTLDVPTISNGVGAENGGDAGGCIVPRSNSFTTTNITGVTAAAPNGRYTYSASQGPALAIGESIFADVNNGVQLGIDGNYGGFVINNVPAGAFRVTNANAVTNGDVGYASTYANCFQ